eukprot:360937-Chlamydomonas_euryale.AAC.1
MWRHLAADDARRPAPLLPGTLPRMPHHTFTPLALSATLARPHTCVGTPPSPPRSYRTPKIPIPLAQLLRRRPGDRAVPRAAAAAAVPPDRGRQYSGIAAWRCGRQGARGGGAVARAFDVRQRRGAIGVHARAGARARRAQGVEVAAGNGGVCGT